MKIYYKIEDENPIYSYCKTIFVKREIGNDKFIYTTIMNPSEEQILAAGWLEYTGPELTEEELLERAKKSKLMAVNAYDASSAVNEFTINNTPMWLDHNVRQQLKASVEAYAASGAESVTKIFNGIEYTFTPEQWMQMLVLLEVYASEALNTTERHKIAINALESIEDVEAYDYTTGYPTKLEF